MSATPVERLNAALEGRYRVERELGQGGMATVYLADDLRHGRKVALKVLKPAVAAAVGAERFLAEIRTTANLQHPHILPLFDSGDADSLLFYVMPYVKGESLRDRLDREHQLPVDEAVQIAKDVAEALDHAHSLGVIHRDIKPANILLQAGRPVLADFGIALAIGAAGVGRLTETGLHVGTPHYMSPEQATGDSTVAATTDVYALGCVLYEMLLGEPPHTGSTPQAILGKIIAGEPASATAQRRSVPLNVDAAIRKSLEKVPADRFARAQDFAGALANEGFRHLATKPGSTAPLRSDTRGRITLAATAVAAAVAGALGWASLGAEAPRPVTRVSVRMPEGQFFNFARGDLDLSRDGSLIVYVRSAPDGVRHVWARRFDALDATLIGDTDDARLPAISPDGREVAFQALEGGPLRVVPLQGGVSRTVLPGDPGICCPSWSPDGVWLYFADASNGLSRVRASGGPPESVTRLDTTSGVTRHSYPEVLPGGERLVYEATTANGPTIQTFELKSGTTKTLTAGQSPRYSSTGHLLFMSVEGVTLLAAPFDVEDLELTGPAVPVARDVLVSPASRDFYAVSQTGRLVYLSGAPGGGGFTPVWVERDGVAREIDPGWSVEANPGNSSLALSPDGTRLALPIRGGEVGAVDIWVKQLDTRQLSRVTFQGMLNGRAVWTPDGQSLTFLSNRAGRFDIWSKRANGTPDAVIVRDTERDIYEVLYSPDGTWMVYREVTGIQGGNDLYAIRPGVDSVAIPIAATEYGERAPAFSPDGRWLAYESNSTGRDEVYIVPFPPEAGSDRVIVSSDGGTEPVWAHGGRELFYKNGADQLMSVTFPGDPSGGLGREVALFSTAGYFRGDGHAMYDVTPDDQRFVMLRSRADAVGTELILVDNWAEDLAERSPD